MTFPFWVLFSVTVKQGLVQQGFVSVGFFANLFLSLFVFFCLFLSLSVFFCLFLAFVIWVVTFSLLMSWGAPAPNTKDQSCSLLGWISLRIRHCPLLLCLVLCGIGCCCCCCYNMLLLLLLSSLLLLLLLLHWSFALVWPLPSVHLRSVPATHVDWCLC